MMSLAFIDGAAAGAILIIGIMAGIPIGMLARGMLRSASRYDDITGMDPGYEHLRGDPDVPAHRTRNLTGMRRAVEGAGITTSKQT